MRDHPLFRSPLGIDRTHPTPIPTPEAFRAAIKDPTIDVLPLTADPKGAGHPGWCTYTYEHEGAPELEVLCGGVNSKTPRAGAVWRQGHLVHFGFGPAPDRLNAAGQALLVNAICYAARFTEDRPIVRTPCAFVQGKRLFDRRSVGRLLADPARNLKDLDYYLAKATYAPMAGQDRAAVTAWYEKARDYLRADDQGKLLVDEDAVTFGVAPADPEFLPRAAAALEDPGRAALARRLLVRYAPEGPAADAPPAAWRHWAADHRPYLFFSDTGGYRWYVDPLAKKRGVPSADLRGPARATRPALAVDPGGKGGYPPPLNPP